MVRSSFPEFSRSVTRPCAKPCSLITAPRRVYTRIHARSQKTMPSKFLWPIKTRLPRGRKNISRSRVERQRERSFHRRRDIFTRARASSLCTVGKTFRHAWTNAEIFFNSSASLTDTSMCLRHIFQNIQLPFVYPFPPLPPLFRETKSVLSFLF